MALKYSVSSAAIFIGNAKIVDCNDMVEGVKICLPLHCKIRKLEESDACMSVANARGLDQGGNSSLSPGSMNFAEISSPLHRHLVESFALHRLVESSSTTSITRVQTQHTLSMLTRRLFHLPRVPLSPKRPLKNVEVGIQFKREMTVVEFLCSITSVFLPLQNPILQCRKTTVPRIFPQNKPTVSAQPRKLLQPRRSPFLRIGASDALLARQTLLISPF